MDLWIRSQDRKSLVKCNDISIASGNRIVGYFDKTTEYETLGIYKTENRALEILDIIQRYVNEKPIMKIGRMFDYQEKLKEFGSGFIITDSTTEIVPAKTMVYEMPKE